MRDWTVTEWIGVIGWTLCTLGQIVCIGYIWWDKLFNRSRHGRRNLERYYNQRADPQ